MNKSEEFEEHLSHLTNDEYSSLIQERLSRLAPEQQVIVQAREVLRKERLELIESLTHPNEDENLHERVFNALRNLHTDNCEHGRSYVKHCIQCAEIDYLMWPEMFDEMGNRLE